MKISVVIPAYNAEQTIGRAIDSVLAQTRPADEIIVVDDGSKDNTADAVKAFGDKVIFVQQKNAGASVARNSGINAATGQWIAFLDGDDQWLDGCLQKHVELLEKNPDLFWSTANFWFCYCNEDRRVLKLSADQARGMLAGKEYFDDYFQAFIQGATGWTGTKMIRKQALIDAGLFTPGQPMANDLDMWWRIAYLYPQIGYIPEPLAIYHLHIDDSITKVHRSPQILIDLIKHHLDLAASHNSTDRFKPCAQHMLRFWLEKYLHDDRIYDIPKIIKQTEDLLSAKQKWRLKLLTVFPGLTKFCIPIYRKVLRK